jgi:hypothetical protein
MHAMAISMQRCQHYSIIHYPHNALSSYTIRLHPGPPMRLLLGSLPDQADWQAIVKAVILIGQEGPTCPLVSKIWSGLVNCCCSMFGLSEP